MTPSDLTRLKIRSSFTGVIAPEADLRARSLTMRISSLSTTERRSPKDLEDLEGAMWGYMVGMATYLSIPHRCDVGIFLRTCVRPFGVGNGHRWMVMLTQRRVNTAANSVSRWAAARSASTTRPVGRLYGSTVSAAAQGRLPVAGP